MENLLDGRYEIKGIIGRGGMGEVYLAYDRKLEVERAIKLSSPNQERNRGACLERLRREAQAAAHIGSHPNVVIVHDLVDAHDEVPDYIVMELLDGETLSEILNKEGRLQLDRVVAMAKDICAGVGAAHLKQIVHRDLSPKNFVVSARSEGEVVKVIDFGVAKLPNADSGGPWTALTSIGDQVGWPPYMAPEQLLDASSVTAQADVYSLGNLLYEALVGQRPFQSADYLELRRQHLDKTADPFPKALQIPIEVEKVVMRALSKKPSDRQSDANKLFQELSAAVNEVAAAKARRDEEKRKRQDAEKRRKAQDEIERLLGEVQRQTKTAESSKQNLQLVESEKRTAVAEIKALRDNNEALMQKLQAAKEHQTRPKLEETSHFTARVVQPSKGVASQVKKTNAVISSQYSKDLGTRKPSNPFLWKGPPVVVGIAAGVFANDWISVSLMWPNSAWKAIALVSITASVIIGSGVFLVRRSSNRLGYRLLATLLGLGMFATMANLGASFVDSLRSADHYNTAERLFDKQQYLRAITEYDQAISLYPNYSSAYFGRGRAHLGQGEYQKAIADYDKVIQLEPEEPGAYHNRAIAYDQTNENDKAIADYSEAIRLEPDDASHYSERGSVYKELKQLDKASTDFDRAAKLRTQKD